MSPIRTGTEMDDNKRAKEEHAVTYTFLSEMSPLPIEMEPIDSNSATSHDSSLHPTPQRTYHGKRRDASYIPRPPNAFILFRSSFIRDQKVTNKVEGNHSNLSKIIGMYWKTLTKEQRDEWEAKAAEALIEHRKRYPDWRFRPATNARSANVKPKMKTKDGTRRGRARKDPSDRGNGDGENESKEGSGRGRPMVRAQEEESRLTKIAGLLVEGQEGEALERAVEEWEAERRMSSRSASVSMPESASSSPVLTCAYASSDREPPPSPFLPAMTRSLERSINLEPSPSPPVPVSTSATSSSVVTRAERKPSLSCLNTKDIPSPSPPRTPRSSCPASMPSASASPLKPPPSWPSSPITPRALASTASTPLLGPISPAAPRTPSFPAFSRTEDWEIERRLTRSDSVSISASASSSLVLSPSLSVSMSASSSPVVTYGSTMEREPEPPTLIPEPSLSCITSASTLNTIPYPSSPSTPRSSVSASTPFIPAPISKWSASPVTPLSPTSTASTPAPQHTSPITPRTSASFKAFTWAEDWEPGQRVSRAMSKSALSSPIVTRALAWSMDQELPASPSVSISTSAQSPSCLYVPSVPKYIPPSSLPLSISTSTPSISIPKSSPSTPHTSSTSVPWPTSPTSPRISSSFPTITRAENWDMEHRVARLNPTSMSVSVRASLGTTDGELSMLNRSPVVSSPIMTRASTSTPSWPPPSPVMHAPPSALYSPIAEWRPIRTSPTTPQASSPTPTSTFTSTSTPARRSRPRSRSPTSRSSQNPNTPMGMKRSLSAPAPMRDHHCRQEPVRMDAGFWWPAPDEHEPEQEGMIMEMPMEEPTREGSFDVFVSQNQETKHEYGIGCGETNEWDGWNWSDLDSDSKSTSAYSSISLQDQIEPAPYERWINPWDADTAIHAGESLYPLQPVPISPLPLSAISTITPAPTRAVPRSSFSSLARWDGTTTEPTAANTNHGTCATGKVILTSIGGMVWGGGGGSGLQRLGVEGGSCAEGCQ
ncbi:hypothetical protein C0995_011330 [Termitomyces sp. Mi166|nr:hypothetical protein C0995_011330 [Termitomyces sp. Mi166\